MCTHLAAHHLGDSCWPKLQNLCFTGHYYIVCSMNLLCHCDVLWPSTSDHLVFCWSWRVDSDLCTFVTVAWQNLVDRCIPRRGLQLPLKYPKENVISIYSTVFTDHIILLCIQYSVLKTRRFPEYPSFGRDLLQQVWPTWRPFFTSISSYPETT